MRILDNIGLVQDPIHQGVDILEKLLNDLKSKLPFLNKKKVIDDEEESDEFDEKTNTDIESEGTDVSDVEDVELDDEDDKSLLTKLKKKFKGSGKSSAAPAGKGKKSNIIIICSLIIMAVLILPDMFEEEPIPTPVLKPRKRPTKKVQPTTETPAEAPSTVDVPTEGVETPPATTTTDLPPADETPAATETPTETEDTTTTTDVTPPESPVDVTVTEPIGETVSESTDSTAVDTTTVEPTTVDTTTSDTTPIDTTSIETPPTEPTTPVIEENPSVDSIDGEVATGGDDNLTDQILKDLESQANTAPKKAAQTEYVRPPDYEYRGRGLVYNCVGKHWACIDGPSYKTCENNASANKYKNKPAECYPFNVYQSQNDCSKMQNRMVSSSAKTNFCQE